MDRKWLSGAAVAPPPLTNASDGYATAGNPGGGIPATAPGAHWYHMVTEELMSVLAAAGIVADKTNVGQLLAAINVLAAAGAWGTGDAKITYKAVADPGWVMANDGTLGSAASGATTRANADTLPLYTLLWNNVTNAWAAVSTGRGANAAADFAANKTLALPKQLGRALTIAGAGSGLTSRALGEILGLETYTLGLPDIPSHNHTAMVLLNAVLNGGGTGNQPQAGNTGNAGGGGFHSILGPRSHMNIMVKL